MSSEDVPEEVMFERSGMKRQGGGDDGGQQGKRHAAVGKDVVCHVWEKV